MDELLAIGGTEFTGIETGLIKEKEIQTEMFEKALANGAEAAKVCGAGGGGCIAFLCAEGRKPEVEGALAESGGEILKWNVAREGLIVKES